MLSERLPDNALDSVSAGCLSTVFLGNGQTESGPVHLVFSVQHRKPFIPAARCFFEHACKSGRIKQPVFFLEPVQRAASQESGVWRWRLSQQSGRELSAAFGAAPLQNKASGFGRHARTKTVCACALDFARLIRTFHLPATWVFCRPLNDLRSGRAARLRR